MGLNVCAPAAVTILYCGRSGTAVVALPEVARPAEKPTHEPLSVLLSRPGIVDQSVAARSSTRSPATMAVPAVSLPERRMLTLQQRRWCLVEGTVPLAVVVTP